MKYIYITLRLLLGLVFVFSGYVKVVDPWGTAIKFDEYLEAMGLGFLESLAFLFSNALSILELLVGYLLVFNIQTKWATRAALLLMLFFTPLTLWLAITGKVTDCGCFGDAIKLTDWQTFGKNLILLPITIFVLKYAKKFIPQIPMPKQRLLFAIGILFSCSILYFSYQHLPLIDFRPFKIGSDIRKGMEIPEGAAVDEYETTLRYEKNGKEKDFTEENFPWQDTTWHFVSSEQKLLKQGYVPPIHDFFIETEDGEDITDAILNSESCILIISHKLEETNFVKKYQESNLKELVNRAYDEKISSYVLTSSTSEQIENISSYIKEKITYCLADEKMLKTFIRANPGIVLLNKGIITGKWSINDLPQNVPFKNKELTDNAKKVERSNYNRQLYFNLLLLVSLAILTLIIIKLKRRSMPRKNSK